MYRYDAPQARPLPRALAARRSRRSAPPTRRSTPRSIQLYSELLRRLGVTQWELQLNSIGDASCRPAYVEKLECLARRARGALRRRRAREARDEPAAGLRREEPGRARGARRCAEDRRLALRRRAASTSPRCAAYLDALGVALHARLRRSCAASTTTRARPSSSSDRPARRPTSAAAAATTASSSRSAVPPTPGVGFGRGLERIAAGARARGDREPSRPGSTSSSSSTAAPREFVLALMAELRAAGLACRHRLRGPLAQGPAKQAGRSGCPAAS